MNDAQKQQQALEVLKSFNQAITTTRLYPAQSPQVGTAVEKAYQAVTDYCQKQGELAFGVSRTGGPTICGRPAATEVKIEAEQLIIFRQLNLLNLEISVFRPGMDRKIFANVMMIFTARKEKIDREGGGRAFVVNLGLDQFFPEEYEPPAEPAESSQASAVDLSVDSSALPDGVLSYLFGEHQREQALQLTQRLLQDPRQAASIIVAGIARVLEHLGKVEYQDLLVVSASFSRFLTTIGSLLPEENKAAASGVAVAAVLEAANDRMLTILFTQKYPEGFGQGLYILFTEASPVELFDRVVEQLRERSASFAADSAKDSPQARIVSETLEKLLATRKGKQFIGREKARELMQSGEKQRQSRRLESAIKALLSGNTDSLKSEEVAFGLPAVIDEMVAGGNDDDALRIIESMAAEALIGDDAVRRRLIQSLTLISEKLLDSKRFDWLARVTPALLSWLRESDNGDYLYEKTAALLQAVMFYGWQSESFGRSDQILALFHKIRSGQLQKSAPVLALIGRIQDRAHNRLHLESFLAAFLAEPADPQAGQRLSMLGRPAALFLLDALLQQPAAAARLQILELLSRMGQLILAPVLEKLPQPMPWYGKRNLIKLVREVGSSEFVDVILPYVRHEDIRVQREAFNCIYIISGDNRKQVLLRSLPQAPEALRVQIVKALLPYSDAETAAPLSVLLQEQEHYSDAVREPLILEILKALSRSGSPAARVSIETFLAERKKKGNRKLGEAVWQTAESALKQLQAALAEQTGATPGRSRPAPPSPGPAAQQQVSRKSVQQPATPDRSGLPGAAEISELLEQHKIELARELILEKITKMSQQRKFPAAERLRDWLIEIDPMALSDIIRAAEIIEEEKIASIDPDDVEVWSDLYDALSTEEFATLYHAMERRSYKNEEVIVKQGSLQSGLLFIASGKVKVLFRDKDTETLIKTAVRGEILGAETIFDASVWTISAACLMKAEVLILRLEKLHEWREEFPSLESKLSDFCMKSESLQQFFSMTGRDRRNLPRTKISGRVSTMLLNNKGEETGISSKGEIFDVAAGGVSFFLRISQKKHARLLLGRKIRVMLPMEGVPSKQLSVLGTIIAVRGHQAMENEYSVHVKFSENLTATELQAVIKTGKSSS